LRRNNVNSNVFVRNIQDPIPDPDPKVMLKPDHNPNPKLMLKPDPNPDPEKIISE
jgi:hypothetical protein